MTTFELVRPESKHLSSYIDALNRDWSPDNVRGKVTADAQLLSIEADPAKFLASLDDPEAKGPPITLPNGTIVPRLPGFVRWMWDGEFCGSINLRWQHGTSELPPHVLGHIGYSVVPWKQRKGYATQALNSVLHDARVLGLSFVELTTDPDNIPSQRVIESNHGILVERFMKDVAYGSACSLRWRIPLTTTAPLE